MQIHETIMPPTRPPPDWNSQGSRAGPARSDDAELLDKAATVMGRTKAELGRALFKGEVTWKRITKLAKGKAMTDTWLIRITLFLTGVVPFTARGGCTAITRSGRGRSDSRRQAIVVLGFIAQRRGWWSSNRTMGA